MNRMEELRRRAERTIRRDEKCNGKIDFSKYDFGQPEKGELSLSELSEEVRRKAEQVGVELKKEINSGTYLQIDHSVVYADVINYLKKKGVIVMSTSEALKKLDWVKEYYWRIIPVDMDRYTAITELELRHGYFIYVPPGVKIERPIQACLFTRRRNVAQPVHNIIIVDENASLNLLTGCVTMANEGLHIGVSEFYVKKNAKVNFIMIHNWSQRYHVRPRTAAIVEQNGVFVSYYVNLYPVQSLQMFPKAYLRSRARAYITSVVLGKDSSNVDIGGGIELLEEGSRGEVVSRSIVKDYANVIMRGLIVGKAPNTRGHLECRGLLLSPNAKGSAIPQLKALTEGTELTHEAAIGRISEEELYYLMARGFTEEEATSLIVRGFLDVGLEMIPQQLRSYLKSILDLVAKLSKG